MVEQILFLPQVKQSAIISNKPVHMSYSRVAERVKT